MKKAQIKEVFCECIKVHFKEYSFNKTELQLTLPMLDYKMCYGFRILGKSAPFELEMQAYYNLNKVDEIKRKIDEPIILFYGQHAFKLYNDLFNESFNNKRDYYELKSVDSGEMIKEIDSLCFELKSISDKLNEKFALVLDKKNIEELLMDYRKMRSEKLIRTTYENYLILYSAYLPSELLNVLPNFKNDLKNCPEDTIKSYNELLKKICSLQNIDYKPFTAKKSFISKIIDIFD